MDTQIWLPIATLVLGLVLGFLADLIKDERAARKDRESRHKQFQRETILEAQDLMGKRFRIEYGFALGLQGKYDAEGIWELDDMARFERAPLVESMDCAMRLLALNSRLQDRKLAFRLSDFVNQSTRMTDGQDAESSYKAADATMDWMRRFNERAKEVLPDLY